MTVRRLRQIITPNELELWAEYLHWEDTHETKQDYALAQLTAEVRRSWVRGEEKGKVKTKDFLLKFAEPKTETTIVKPTPSQSKSVWLGALGIDPSKPKKKKGKKHG